jgi:hypothetical protein
MREKSERKKAANGVSRSLARWPGSWVSAKNNALAEGLDVSEAAALSPLRIEGPDVGAGFTESSIFTLANRVSPKRCRRAPLPGSRLVETLLAAGNQPESGACHRGKCWSASNEAPAATSTSFRALSRRSVAFPWPPP